VLDLPRLPQAGVEGLPLGLGDVAAVAVQQLAPAVGEDDDGLATAVEGDGARQAGFGEMSQVAPAGIGRPVQPIAEVAGRDHAEGAAVASMRLSDPRRS
jgi:hypothetical protein